MQKKIRLIAILGFVLLLSLLGLAWAQSSTGKKIIPIVSMLLLDEKPNKTTLKDEVIPVDDTTSDEIVDVVGGVSGNNTSLTVDGDLADNSQSGSIILVQPGVDDRFPLGFSGRVTGSTDNPDGTKTVDLEKVNYAEVIDASSLNLGDIPLTAENFIGVIAPSGVEAATPANAALDAMTSTSIGKNAYSFRDGAIVVGAPSTTSSSLDRMSGVITPPGSVSLNIKVDLASMGDGVHASTMQPVEAGASVGFVITGELDDIKLTNDIDFGLPKGLKDLNLRLDGDLNVNVGFKGKGSVEFGYFSQAWNEVKDETFNLLGIDGSIYGLSVDDKIGKFPIAGLVWSVKCPNACPVLPGKTQKPLRQAKTMGVIVWLYLTLTGEFSLDGDLDLVKINDGALSLGASKLPGGKLKMIKSLQPTDTTARFIEAPSFSGDIGFNAFGGFSTDFDVFAAGIYLANAGMDVGFQGDLGVTGNLSYGADSLSSPWDWHGSACFNANYGAGAVFRVGTRLGVKIDTAWKKVSADFAYEWQLPTDEAMNSPGWHGAWYTADGTYQCWPPVTTPTVTSLTGRIWMDRNLGASRVATSSNDAQAYGDLYQWGRGTDGHEKRNSPTTSTKSTTDVPGHGSFILEGSSPPYDEWRTPPNSNLWQGEFGTNNPCPSGFRLPTELEWEIEYATWSSRNIAGAFASPLKLVAAGGRSGQDGSVVSEGVEAGYWSGTSTQYASYFLGYADVVYGVIQTSRIGGLSVRCIED